MYESISGVSLLWKDEALYDTFEMDYVKGVLPDKIDDRIDYTMKAAGYNYIRLRKDMGRKAVFSQIKASVDNNIPVMLYMGNRGNWTPVSYTHLDVYKRQSLSKCRGTKYFFV